MLMNMCIQGHMRATRSNANEFSAHARHSAAAQPTKLISAIVGAFVLLQILTVLCKNAGNLTEHEKINDQSKCIQHQAMVACNNSNGHSSCTAKQSQPHNQQQRPQCVQQNQQQPFARSIVTLLALALLQCNNVTAVDRQCGVVPSTAQLTYCSPQQQRRRQEQQLCKAQTVSSGIASVKSASSAR
ncbi:unnamed protein product [Ceratitis capitata]|uniref:(Mediterranean fruit fly) hypothetical protein n=1 Tax=Ceratitis capitata TaxID=7213 RepID=A0A811UWQ2_CERCA|nr:unnamed protein product [Ceratitis capitata]